jgi:hypothetical protein
MRKLLAVGLCALILISFTLLLANNGVAQEAKKQSKQHTLTGMITSGKLVVKGKEYTLAGDKAAEVTKLEGKKVSVTGTIEDTTITIIKFHEVVKKSK